MDNAGGSEPCGKGTCQVWSYNYNSHFLQQMHVGKYLKFKVAHLTVTQKRFFASWDAKFVIILPMLEKLKESFISGLIIIKANTDLFKKGNSVPKKLFDSHYISLNLPRHSAIAEAFAEWNLYLMCVSKLLLRQNCFNNIWVISKKLL